MSEINLNQAELERLSMVDLANLIFSKEQRPMSFKEAFDQIAVLKNWDEAEKQGRIAQFYTDLNIDGRFVTNGTNSWGLKRWYRTDQISDDLSLDDLEDMIEDDEDVEDDVDLENDADIAENSLDSEDYETYDDEDTEIEDVDLNKAFDEEYEDDFENSPI